MTASDQDTPRANLSVLDGVAMMVGIIVGIGIFKTPALVAANVASEGAALGLWLLGGAVTLVGALVYAELGAAYPSTGGEYHYLARGLDRSVAILFAWARMTVIQTGAIAAVAFVFGDYASQLLSLGAYSQAIYAALSIAAFTLISLAGASPSKNAQLAFTGATILTIGLLVLISFMAGSAAQGSPAASSSGSGGGGWGLAMIFILLTYGGWNEAAYISVELQDVRRNMVRVLVLSVAAVVVIYLLVNLAFLHVIGLEGLRASNAIATDLMRRTTGEAGAALLSVVVCCAALSTLNGTIFTGARVYHAVGRDVAALRALGIWDPDGQKPTNALLLQGAIATALVAFGAVTRDGFQAIVEYTAPVFWLFLFLVGVSFFRLRGREPDRERPFRVPLYPLTPALFCLTCAYLFYSSVAYTGFGALLGLLVLAAGLPLLMLARRDELQPEQSREGA
jgi:basic amino acid/polyamine antiporter, APA family